MEKALFPMPTMQITQGYINSSTHQGSYALDLAGEDSGIDWVLAPFTGKVVDILSNSTVGNWYWFESLDEVLCANGEIQHLTCMFGHDNKMRHQIGDVIEQGENLCAEGTSGNASGNHCHLEVGVGKYTGNRWHMNYAGVYIIDNAIKPNLVLAKPNGCYVKNDGNLLWRSESEVIRNEYSPL